eukprot:TRINITY_DN15436_c0_g1_i1.p1 TRINITY_DN15436_c0_g1~~TRINITY_DN15436_c0_g1_i1.p1  ORF type:complete len:1543 (-),score=483.23 TRINITY_DN15436_c0_g1_i1:77-4705(-)
MDHMGAADAATTCLFSWCFTSFWTTGFSSTGVCQHHGRCQGGGCSHVVGVFNEYKRRRRRPGRLDVFKRLRGSMFFLVVGVVVVGLHSVGASASAVAASGSADASSGDVVQKVLKVLSRMQEQVSAEVKKEYEDFEEAMSNSRSAETELRKSQTILEQKMPDLEAAIQDAKASEAQLGEEIKGLTSDRDDANKAITDARSLREEERLSFETESTETKANIRALQAAAEALGGITAVESPPDFRLKEYSTTLPTTPRTTYVFTTSSTTFITVTTTEEVPTPAPTPSAPATVQPWFDPPEMPEEEETYEDEPPTTTTTTMTRRKKPLKKKMPVKRRPVKKKPVPLPKTVRRFLDKIKNKPMSQTTFAPPEVEPAVYDPPQEPQPPIPATAQISAPYDPTDGGGWFKVLEYADDPYVPTADAVGQLSQGSPAGFAKLSDDTINIIASDDYFVRLMSSTNSWRAYLAITGQKFDDTKRAFGLTEAPYEACVANAFHQCTWRPYTAGQRFDTAVSGASVGDEKRWYTDFGRNPDCFGVPGRQVRCFNCGVKCGADGIRHDVTMWIKRADHQAIQDVQMKSKLPDDAADEQLQEEKPSPQFDEGGGPGPPRFGDGYAADNVVDDVVARAAGSITGDVAGDSEDKHGAYDYHSDDHEAVVQQADAEQEEQDAGGLGGGDAGADAYGSDNSWSDSVPVTTPAATTSVEYSWTAAPPEDSADQGASDRRSFQPVMPEDVVDGADGGGWVKVLEYADEPYLPTAASVGQLGQGDPQGFAKLSDEEINIIAGDSYYVRFMSTTNEIKAYLDIEGIRYSDTARSMGFGNKPYKVCVAESFSQCQWSARIAGPLAFDTGAVRASADDNSRWFTDFGKASQCYGLDQDRRCFSCGPSCGERGFRADVTVWVKRKRDMSMAFLQQSYKALWKSGAAATRLKGLAMAGDYLDEHDSKVLLQFLQQGVGGRRSEDGKPLFSVGAQEVLGILHQMGATMNQNLREMYQQEADSRTSYEDLLASKKEEVRLAVASLQEKTAAQSALQVQMSQLHDDLEATKTSFESDGKVLGTLLKEQDVRKEDHARLLQSWQDEAEALNDVIELLQGQRQGLPEGPGTREGEDLRAGPGGGAVTRKAKTIFEKSFEAVQQPRAEEGAYDYGEHVAAASFLQTDSSEEAEGGADEDGDSNEYEAAEEAEEEGGSQNQQAGEMHEISLHSAVAALEAFGSGGGSEAVPSKRGRLRGKHTSQLQEEAAEDRQVQKQQQPSPGLGTAGKRKAHVGSIVKDLIGKMLQTMKEEQEDDDERIKTCRSDLDSNSQRLTELKANLERDKQHQDAAAVEESQTKTDIDTLKAGIMALDKEMDKATAQRKEENTAFVADLESTRATNDLLQLAKQKLKRFYHEGREDAANDESKVVEIIELIQTDLKKQFKELQRVEKDAQLNYEKLVKVSAQKRRNDLRATVAKEEVRADLQGRLRKLKKDVSAANEQIKAVEAVLGDLHEQCDFLLEHYDLRKHRRTSESDSLRTAGSVVQAAHGPGLLQKKPIPSAQVSSSVAVTYE